MSDLALEALERLRCGENHGTGFGSCCCNANEDVDAVQAEIERLKESLVDCGKSAHRLLEIIQDGAVALELHSGEVHIRRSVLASIKSRVSLLAKHIDAALASRGGK